MFLISWRGYWQELIESIVLSGADEASTLQFLAPYNWMYRDLQLRDPTRSKSTVKSTSKSASKKKGPKTHFIHAGLAQIDFEAEFAKVVKNAVQGAPH